MAHQDGFNAVDIILDERMVTSLSSAVTVTWAPSGTRWVDIDVEDQAVRVWEGGATPTTSSGRLLYPGDSIRCWGKDPQTNLKIIEVTASAKVSVTCGR